MTRMLKLASKSKYLLIVLLLFLTSTVTFSNNVIGNFNNSVGPIVLKDSKIIVTGDSFAGKFCEYEKNKDLYIIPYARAGCTIDQNQIIMALALNFDERNILISIGVNDQFMETPPYRFEAIMRRLLNIGLYYNKNVFMHSYLMYFSSLYNLKRFSALEYDAIIKRLCEEYDNAYYIDVKDLENPIYISDDNMHYNSLFYDELYVRLLNLMLELEKAQEKQ